MISAVATLNKKPSAIKFAPFSMALKARRIAGRVSQPLAERETWTGALGL
jgi:hypothetical protein